MSNKYGARAVEEDGYRFASMRERDRYRELKLRARAQEISNLRVHPRWVLAINGQIIGHYTADFAYLLADDGTEIVEDVKGGRATKTEAYRLRKKLMLAIHGIRITEVE